ncbi:MAG: hypothetical protein M3347_12645, partial [Armatimonadota bacterium]|nr:hypothetical protein [Armatimonadota bacterium]
MRKIMRAIEEVYRALYPDQEYEVSAPSSREVGDASERATEAEQQAAQEANNRPPEHMQARRQECIEALGADLEERSEERSEEYLDMRFSKYRRVQS